MKSSNVCFSLTRNHRYWPIYLFYIVLVAYFKNKIDYIILLTKASTVLCIYLANKRSNACKTRSAPSGF